MGQHGTESTVDDRGAGTAFPTGQDQHEQVAVGIVLEPVAVVRVEAPHAEVQLAGMRVAKRIIIEKRDNGRLS